MAPPQNKPPLSSILPPIIFGCGTFNYQYVSDPHTMDANSLIQYALAHGFRAFDTSPYYGPSETILGEALNTPYIREHFSRHEYYLITKVGRVGADVFDYSPEWIRNSVGRSLERLKTEYLDMVYCHDVEFVSEEEAVEAVRELRRIRDEEGTVKYVGVSGYPLEVLCSIAKRVLNETGEPLDAVMSYANFTLQNTLLASSAVEQLREAGVDVVPNASPLGMGMLRREGVPGDWHPASSELRAAVRRASDFCDDHNEKLEDIAIRYVLQNWVKAGTSVGSRGDPASGVPWKQESVENLNATRLGVSVLGFTRKHEVENGLKVWRSVLDGLEGGDETAKKAGRWSGDHVWSLNRQQAVQILADGVRELLGSFVDYAWDSPPKGFVNQLVKDKQEVNDGALITPVATP